MLFIVATNVVPVDRPNTDRLEHRTLVPIKYLKCKIYYCRPVRLGPGETFDNHLFRNDIPTRSVWTLFTISFWDMAQNSILGTLYACVFTNNMIVFMEWHSYTWCNTSQLCVLWRCTLMSTCRLNGLQCRHGDWNYKMVNVDMAFWWWMAFYD